MAKRHTISGMTLVNLAKSDTLSDRLAIEVKTLLIRRGLRQSALAEALDVPAMWVSDRLSGKTQISTNDLARIAGAFEIESWELVRAADGGSTLRYPSARNQHVFPPHVPPVSKEALRSPLPQPVGARYPDRPADNRPRNGPTGKLRLDSRTSRTRPPLGVRS